jgi:hypothetical protein
MQWVRGNGFENLVDLWDKCPRSDWMHWLLEQIKYPNNNRALRLYAVWCARQVEYLMTDERGKNALDVAVRYANGKATDEELAAAGDAAWAAAWAAARDAAWDATRTAARAAARAAARDAAWAATRTAAGDAAWDAARAAARAAAWDAARAAARAAARDAAWAAARAAAWAKQADKLREMITNPFAELTSPKPVSAC